MVDKDILLSASAVNLFIEEPAYVEDKNGCWIWQGYINKRGYGIASRKGLRIRAHRLFYQAYKGAIKDLHVLHKCDNPSCVNPDHLFLGTHKDNMRDKAKKGRAPGFKGESNPFCKLTFKQVLKIRELYETGKYSQRRLAKMFDSSQTNIGGIVRKERRLYD